MYWTTIFAHLDVDLGYYIVVSYRNSPSGDAKYDDSETSDWKKAIIRIRILRLLSSNYDNILSDKQFQCTGRQYLDIELPSGDAKHDDSETSDEKNDRKNWNFTTFVVKLWRYLVG